MNVNRTFQLNKTCRMTPDGLHYTCWTVGKWWPGFLNQAPLYLTQGRNRKDLEVHLESLHEDMIAMNLTEPSSTFSFPCPTK